MKLTTTVRERLQSVYAHERIENRTIIASLTYSLILLALAAVAVSLASVGDTVQRIALLAIALVLVGMVALVLVGKARAVSVALTTALSAFLPFLVFLNGKIFGFTELYMISAFSLLVLALANLIGYYTWQTIISASIGLAAFAADLFLRVLPWAENASYPIQWDDVAINALLPCIVCYCVYATQRRSRSFIVQAGEEAERSARSAAALKGAMEASRESLKIGSELDGTARETAARAEGARGEVSLAEDLMGDLAGESASLGMDLAGIAQDSRKTRESAEAQGSVVTETSAAIEEMTASIRGIDGITRQRKEAVDRLAAGTAEGQSVVAQSSEAMKAVQASASSILDIVKVISAVASQTNLLAMNAAIEAAHAGEYGRGFSVVADEIRKLSEQTGSSVKAVTDTVRATLSDISKAADCNDKAVTAFASIAQEALLVSSAMEEISRGLGELSLGTEEINKGVADSVASTETLRTSVASVDEKIAAATKSLEGLEASSQAVLAKLVGVKGQIDAIEEEARQVEAIGASNRQGLERMREALDRSEA